jgi:hypothetical protein
LRLEGLRVDRDGARVRRTAELAWIGGETTLTVTVPAEYAPADDDLSPFVPVALMSAMRRAEPLQCDGAVSALLIQRLPEAQEIISAWNPTLRRIAVRAARAAEPAGELAPGRACCFSRGVDSTYSAAVERPPGDELSHLVHWRDFTLSYSERTRAREIELAGEAARRLGLPLVVVESDVPKALAGVVDFNDATSAMLASVILSLPGLSGRMVIPSTLGFGDLSPFGAHPQLDPLWSTERVRVEHDSAIPTRDDKVAWLARNRTDLLELIHVCMEQDSPDNCGQCGKCLWTMLLLHLNGALGAAPFPDRIDPERVRKTPRQALYRFLAWERIHEALGDSAEDAALKKAIRHSIRVSARSSMSSDSLSMIAQHTRRLHRLLRGRLSGMSPAPLGEASAAIGTLDPAWPPPRGHPPGALGLVRAVDHDARRHQYAVGGLPPGQRSGELGALAAERPAESAVPFSLDVDGRPQPGDLAARGSRRAVARWVVDPLVWRGPGAATARLRSVARRTATAARTRRWRGRREPVPAEPTPAGWLYAEGASGRVGLWAAAHPVLDDVLLTTDADEARELGYGSPKLLGYLEDRAPVTGVTGIAEVPIPWARRWGRRT